MKNEKRASLVGPPKLWQSKRDCQIKFLLEHGLKQDHYLLDLGCGVLRGGIPIINYLEKTLKIIKNNEILFRYTE